MNNRVRAESYMQLLNDYCDLRLIWRRYVHTVNAFVFHSRTPYVRRRDCYIRSFDVSIALVSYLHSRDGDCVEHRYKRRPYARYLCCANRSWIRFVTEQPSHLVFILP